MVFLESGWHVFSSLLIFWVALFYLLQLSKKLQVSAKLVVLFYFWHSLFCIVFFLYVNKYGGDAVTYLTPGGVFDNRPFKLGTVAVIYTVRFLQEFGLSGIGISLCFNMLGVIGGLYLYSALTSLNVNKDVFISRIILFFLFFPSLSFWSSGVGKDSVSFLSIAMAIYAFTEQKPNFRLLLFSFFLMLLVRPHIAGIMLIAFALSVSFDRNIKPMFRFFILLCAVTVSSVMIPFVLNSLNVNAGVSDVSEYINSRASSNMGGGSSLEITAMPLPLQLFTYFFRPLPHEAQSLTQLVEAFFNVFLVYILALGLYTKIKCKNKLRESSNFLYFYFLGAGLILAMTTANLGIAVRQKWMLVPVLFFLLIRVIVRHRANKIIRSN